MKIICIGRNYVDHIAELNNEKPTEPVVFLKPDTALLPYDADFYIPEFSQNVQHEIEVVIKINKVGKYIDVKFAHKYYNEITVGIDFTARDLQDNLKSKGLPWEKSKAFDNSAVVGKFIDKNSLNSIQNTIFELINNGNSVQKGNTNLMLFSIDEIISSVSQYFTLKTGDLIFTGTPAGVAKVKTNDILEGFLENQKLFRILIK